jgi:hypothetical protein
MQFLDVDTAAQAAVFGLDPIGTATSAPRWQGFSLPARRAVL